MELDFNKILTGEGHQQTQQNPNEPKPTEKKLTQT